MSEELKNVTLAANKMAGEIERLKAELARRTEDVAFLERATLPELRREIEHHKAGKQRWRDRAEKAERFLAALEAAGVDSWEGYDDAREAAS